MSLQQLSDLAANDLVGNGKRLFDAGSDRGTTQIIADEPEIWVLFLSFFDGREPRRVAEIVLRQSAGIDGHV